MVERESPLGPAFRPGLYGNSAREPGVTIDEVTPHFMAETAAWPDQTRSLAGAIADVTGLPLTDAPNAGALGTRASAFSVGPGRFLVTGGRELPANLAAAVPLETGTVTDLSHARTAIRIAGPRAEWVLSKLFAIDFSPSAFPVAEGRATSHHDIAAQIQRVGPAEFDIYVFRSFARAFWRILCDSAQEVGYRVSGGQRP